MSLPMTCSAGHQFRNSVDCAAAIFHRRIVADEADVVHQRVEPDVGDEVLIERELDAPLSRDAGREMQRSPSSFSTALRSSARRKSGDDTSGAIVDDAEAATLCAARA